MSRKELEAALDFILNRADPSEFEVLAKACERRRRDMGKYAGLGGLNPGALADKMAASVQEGVGRSLDGLRDTLRDYVARLVRQKEPGATDEQIEALLDECLPDRSDPSSGARDVPAADSLPPEAVAMMVRDFVDYSLGLMPPSRQRELWEGLDAWQDKYWQAFSPELRAFVKARLEGRLAEDEFWSAVFSLLGL
ncbi:MAG TPA: hypothetical protein PLI66_03495 [Spirochaetales bacterium]|nr:hypothetical protein [Spirochaetales bacterium]HPG85828.1 hypothetical protein [Spirochaetales bacterium]HPM71837.1 hypothetical protein [Spirochaetales bacterium]HQO65774.1 hypothetical protein [Spirochaetales bacterium]